MPIGATLDMNIWKEYKKLPQIQEHMQKFTKFLSDFVVRKPKNFTWIQNHYEEYFSFVVEFPCGYMWLNLFQKMTIFKISVSISENKYIHKTP